MDATNPTRQVALVRKTGPSRDFGQPKLPGPNKLGRSLHAQMYDVTMWGEANRLCKHPREVERAAPGNARELIDLDLFVNVGKDLIFEPLEDRFTQCASRPRGDRGTVTSKQIVDEVAGSLVPEERSIGVVGCALQRQGAG